MTLQQTTTSSNASRLPHRFGPIHPPFNATAGMYSEELILCPIKGTDTPPEEGLGLGLRGNRKQAEHTPGRIKGRFLNSGGRRGRKD